MSSFYSVVRYVPDPVAEEQVNIGVLAFREGEIYARFLDKWNRVVCFAGDNIGFLQEFASRIEESVSEELFLEEIAGRRNLDEESIRKFAGSWSHTIQFSEPRASLLDPDRLITYAADRFLRELSPVSRSRARSRRQAASTVEKHLRNAVEARVPSLAHEMVKGRALLPGTIEEHQFDAVVQNGHPYLAAHGMSFEVRDQKDVQKEVDSLAYQLSDVRNILPDLPISVMAFLPKAGASDQFRRTRQICRKLSIDLLEESEVEDWADTVISRYSWSHQPVP